MCKTRPTTAGPLWTGSILLCALLMSACGNESSSTTSILGSEFPAPASLITENIPGPDSWSDLSGDALTPPEQPRLHISAEPATLILEWSPIADQRVARLYRYDSALPGEALVYESDESQRHLLHLPSATVQTPWHRIQYRLELCTVDNCLSSERMSLSGLAPETAQYLTPAVFLRGERYAEHLAVNRDASLAVISMPVEGALEFHVRSGTQWSVSQKLRLTALPGPTSRRLLLSASDSGDTVAVFIENRNKDGGEIRTLERLGETWIQTAKLPLSAEKSHLSADDEAPVLNTGGFDERQQSLQLSADGNGLLLQSDGMLHTSRRTESGWSLPQVLVDTGHYNTSSTPDNLARLAGSTASRDFTRIMAVVQQDGTTYLDLWSAEQDMEAWQHTAHLPLSDFSHDHELALRSNAQGDELLIAGWEAGARAQRNPIMWHYSLDQGSGVSPTAQGMTLQAISSLRAPPTSQSRAALVFNASESLTQVLMGWQLVDDAAAGTLPDAVVSTWEYHIHSRLWLSDLELPEAIPTLAKQALASAIVLSADGSTLMMATGTRHTHVNMADIDEVLVLR